MVQPLTLRERKILLRVEFTHSEALRPQKVDPGTSLPIGSPVISSQTLLNRELPLTPGEPMIVGGLDSSGLHLRTIIRAEVLSN
jgi:hypothetical protein